MASFLLLLVCLVLGTLIAHFGRPPEGLARSLNWWILYIALPAVVVEIIPHLQFDVSLWFLLVSMWLIFAVSWLLFHHLGVRLNWSRGTIGAVVLTAGLCNSAFVGFPLIEALRGKQALPYAAIADQLGSFMNVSVGGSIVVAMYSGGAVSTRIVLRKIMMFPPFVALIMAIVVALLPAWPPLVDEVLARIGATLAPLALFSVGLQLRLKLSAHRIVPMLTGLSWKLGMAPLMILGLGMALQINPAILTVALLQSSMAPMMTTAILAEQGNLDPPLANMMVGIGILISFITVPLWNLAT